MCSILQLEGEATSHVFIITRDQRGLFRGEEQRYRATEYRNYSSIIASAQLVAGLTQFLIISTTNTGERKNALPALSSRHFVSAASR